MGLLLLDNNASYADRCGMYAATAAELVVAKVRTTTFASHCRRLRKTVV